KAHDGRFRTRNGGAARARREPAPPEGDDRRALPQPLPRARGRPQGGLHLRPRKLDRADRLARPLARPSRDQCAAVRDARPLRQLHRRGGEGRPLRGRVHLREVRPRDDAPGERGSDGREAAAARFAAALVHRLLHLHEMVRAATRALQMPRRDAPRPVPGRGAHLREHAPVRGGADPPAGGPRAGKAGGEEARRGGAIAALRRPRAFSRRAEDDLVAVWESARQRPSPIDGYFGGVYYVGPIFSAFRGTAEAAEYYSELRSEVEDRAARGEGPLTPDGPAS